ncbi:hypothetical protein LOTGIDRAFT_169505 [Lottia gigantea]|uniref:BHLH domain-containing protein n=1 Tax=Lottia gigantea TaxID=225164 RepID=V3ZLJ2_LOTGI|nr:hypothetical protein LOTGIDRAFT_169505 [Lottia gigantea]ESO83285.1 hypothetical protein LOTGIDRAFT_169505 [Lottia gigantea]
MVRAVSARLNQSAAQITAKKSLKLHLRRIRDREYCKLRDLVPSVASKKKVSKVEVVEEAVRYIEELHQALLERFRRKAGGIRRKRIDNIKRRKLQMIDPELH